VGLQITHYLTVLQTSSAVNQLIFLHTIQLETKLSWLYVLKILLPPFVFRKCQWV